MSDYSIILDNLGKMYKLYNSQNDRIKELFNIKFGKNYYKEFWVLRNINLEIKRGERIGILGKNGAGKSTLLKIISGSVAPTEGAVSVRGKIQALLELGTGFHPELTGRENLHSVLSVMGYSSKKIKLLEEEIIDFAELEEFIEQPVKFYSAGMYTRLAFSVSTSIEPEILIIDEVLGAGDVSFTQKCQQRIKRITHELGSTVLFVSHSMSSILEFCDRAVLLEDGLITHDDLPLTVSKIYNHKMRQEEELALKAKELKIRKKDLKKIANSLESNALLFRIITENYENPTKTHLFFSAKIVVGDQILASVDIGKPMDNNELSSSCIIDAPGLTNWSAPLKINSLYCRAYQNEKGGYVHAPFKLGIPQGEIPLKESKLILKGVVDDREKVFLDFFWDNKYIRLGEIMSQQEEHVFDLYKEKEIVDTEDFSSNIEVDRLDLSACKDSDIIDNDMDNINPTEIIDSTNEMMPLTQNYTGQHSLLSSLSCYCTHEILAEDYDIVDKHGKSVRTFIMGEEWVFNIKARKKDGVILERFDFVLCILKADGSCATQTFVSSEELGILKDNIKFSIQAKLNPLRLGAGEYMVSIGFFKKCNFLTMAEDEAFLVIDRSIPFKVFQSDKMYKSLGAFGHPVVFKCNQGNEVFCDPSTAYLP
jgi:lipopolysaccharide transport system ATP-binding protein